MFAQIARRWLRLMKQVCCRYPVNDARKVLPLYRLKSNDVQYCERPSFARDRYERYVQRPGYKKLGLDLDFTIYRTIRTETFPG